jgi:hypothetical protein
MLDPDFQETSSVVDYSKEKNPYLLRQAILNAIARKNAMDRGKNKLFGTSNKDERERQIKQVLQEILNMPNLADYKVTSAISGAFGSMINTYGQGLLGPQKYHSDVISNNPQLDPLGPRSGGKTRRRRRRGRKSRKH